jgi:hypothetical protein
MSESTSDPGPARAVPDDPTPAADARGPVCQVAWCPFCIAVGAVQPIRPEMVEHLLKAGTELLLAVRAVVDARADAVTGEPDASDGARLEKIDLG